MVHKLLFILLTINRTYKNSAKSFQFLFSDAKYFCEFSLSFRPAMAHIDQGFIRKNNVGGDAVFVSKLFTFSTQFFK